jgi:hypothetical protein
MSYAAKATLAAALAVALQVVGCGGRGSVRPKYPQALPVRTDVEVGECADPAKQGVIGRTPNLVRADRDLDGDRVAEIVVADRELCTVEGNCHWNLYRRQGQCYRYLGTVSAASLQRVGPRSEGFIGLRGWWKLTAGERILLQEYRFLRGGYRLVEALPCRQTDDDRIVCAERGR